MDDDDALAKYLAMTGKTREVEPEPEVEEAPPADAPVVQRRKGKKKVDGRRPWGYWRRLAADLANGETLRLSRRDTECLRISARRLGIEIVQEKAGDEEFRVSRKEDTVRDEVSDVVVDDNRFMGME